MQRPQQSWTVLIVPPRGGATRKLSMPAWTLHALRASAVLFLSAAVFVGWQLQARFGLRGPLVAELSELPWGAARGSLFMSMGLSRATPTPAERRRRASLERAARLGLGDRKAASSLLLGELEPVWLAEVQRSSRSDGTLRWPVANGWYGRGYGSGEGGYHLAVDINAEAGSDVMAAAAGMVGYAGHELRGFGNVVLLVHPGGWITLYGHNQRNLVVPGQRVAQGEPIAALGSTGRSMGPHVHFELIYAGHNCDPMPLVAQGPESYRNYEPAGAPLVWLPGTPRPAQIRCARRMAHPMHEEEGADSPVPLAAASPTSAAARQAQ
jgi:murein DD-endopeptidase MepM/ murein hydrolase activator NlpD